MNQIIPNFLQELKNEPIKGVIVKEVSVVKQSLNLSWFNNLLQLQFGSNSARTHHTSQIMRLVGTEINQQIQRINASTLQEFRTEMQVHARDNSADMSGIEPVLVLLPTIAVENRSDRGLPHDVTGHLLCPIQFKWEDTK